ncbi:uncharacterized protein CC84DRAFT_276448 [Paraphaeosphaeria sporulosa]|uniref:Uncharacterized protein n=1 Tax=Paraphaeosphaeria sporulosa TaxID=1460663 RepID=A0A177C0R1_9PLEO|nr:uncharacterized protein CC84DRAFT_276448 [Paraphaeosphaeria sporulosa]OAG01075.1 hypothetical protein CC84DRAFT_276448 [Paraphaeosphaeria sporulosa]
MCAHSGILRIFATTQVGNEASVAFCWAVDLPSSKQQGGHQHRPQDTLKIPALLMENRADVVEDAPFCYRSITSRSGAECIKTISCYMSISSAHNHTLARRVFSCNHFHHTLHSNEPYLKSSHAVYYRQIRHSSHTCCYCRGLHCPWGGSPGTSSPRLQLLVPAMQCIPKELRPHSLLLMLTTI